MLQLKILTAIFFAGGIVVLGIFSWVAIGRLRLQQNGATTNGHVIRLELRTRRAYFPVVEFQTPDGRRIVFKSESGSYPPSFRIGESVPVLYDPADPQHAFIRTFLDFWGGVLIALVLAVTCTGVSGGVIVAQMRKRRRFAMAKAIRAARTGAVRLSGAGWVNPGKPQKSIPDLRSRAKSIHESGADFPD